MYQGEVLVVGLAAGAAAAGQGAAVGLVEEALGALVEEVAGVVEPVVVGKKVLKL